MHSNWLLGRIKVKYGKGLLLFVLDGTVAIEDMGGPSWAVRQVVSTT